MFCVLSNLKYLGQFSPFFYQGCEIMELEEERVN